jgi:hypothetical protein
MKMELGAMPDGTYLVTMFDVERIEDGSEVDLDCRFEVLRGLCAEQQFSQRIKVAGRRAQERLDGEWKLMRLTECVGRAHCTGDPRELLTGRPFFVEVEHGRLRRVFESDWRYRDTHFILSWPYDQTGVTA